MPQLVESRHIKVTTYASPPSTSVAEAASSSTCNLLNPDRGITRPSPVVRTPNGVFRPFTNYSVSGWAYTGIPFGQLEVTEPSVGKTVVSTYDTWVTRVDVDMPPFPAVDRDQFDSVVARAYAQAKTNGLDWLTEVSELPEVFKLLGNVRKGIINCLRMAFNEMMTEAKVWRKIRKQITLEQVMNYWLQARYGWRPLLSSILQVQEALETIKKKVYISSGGDKNTRVITGVTGATVERFCIASGYRLPLNVATVATQTVRGRAALFLSPSGVALNANLARTAWERVPLSFVVDWFFSVGSLITEVQEAICPTVGTCCYSIDNRVTVRITTAMEQIPESSPSLQVRVPTPMDMVYDKYTYNRVVASGLNPNLRITNKLDPLKGLDLISIIAQWTR